MFRCGDHDALVSYVYEECDGADAARIRAHLDACGDCAEDVGALGETRRQLLAWSPPEVVLGVRVTSATGPATPVRSAPAGTWWTQPLPAWAQAAAAVLIFAAGLSVGASRAPAAGPAMVATGAPGNEAVAPGALPQDLVRLEERFRAAIEEQVRAGIGNELAALRAAVAPAPVTDEVLQHVEALVARSEERQRREMTELGNDLYVQRREDLRRMQAALANLEGRQRDAFGQLAEHREAIGFLSQQGEAIGFLAHRR